MIDEESTARGNNQTPHLSVDFVISQVGYQMDLYIGGELMGIECRDFGGCPGPPKAIEALVHELQDAVDHWRSML